MSGLLWSNICVCYHDLRQQEDLNKQAPAEQTETKKKGFMGTVMGFVLGTDRYGVVQKDDDDDEKMIR